jgi:hypothetical protein
MNTVTAIPDNMPTANLIAGNFRKVLLTAIKNATAATIHHP